MQVEFNDGGRAAAGYKGFTGDCVCRAIAIASGRYYQEVYDRLAHGNWKQPPMVGHRQSNKRTAANGINVDQPWFHQYMFSLDFEYTHSPIDTQVYLNELPSEGKLVVVIKRHCLAILLY